MKRRITAARATMSTSDRHNLEKLQSKIVGLQADRKLIAKCDTLEEALRADWNYWQVGKIIARDVNSGKHTFEEAAESWVDSLTDMIKQAKEDYAFQVEYNEKAPKLLADIFAKLEKLNYKVEQLDQDTLMIVPPEGANHKDCINFVDAVVDAIHGKYSFTGRGGSWTVWDLRSEDGIAFKAGWDDNSNNWVVYLAS